MFACLVLVLSLPAVALPPAPAVGSKDAPFHTEFDSISGTVTNEESGEPLSFVGIELFADSEVVASQEVDSSGSFTFFVEPGTYLVGASRHLFQDELYDDVPCYVDECDLADATPVEVLPGASVDGIDFALRRSNAVFGIVYGVNGTRLGGCARVSLHDSSGALLEEVWTSAFVNFGRYGFEDRVPGTYYLRAYAIPNEIYGCEGYVPELYGGLHCPEPCDVTAGTPIQITDDASLFGRDIHLDQSSDILAIPTLGEAGLALLALLLLGIGALLVGRVP